MRASGWLCFPLAAAVLASGPAGAVTIELNDVAADRVERQRAFAEGSVPLPGTPDLTQLDQRLEAKGLKVGAALFVRVFKAESELEIWLKQGDRFVLLDTYPICHWSGTMGPKLSEGDKQNPEGFYTIGARQLHRSGRWPRSLNLGYPNRYDRAMLRTGSYILVHGGCSSTGCFAMTDGVIAEIYKLAQAALRGGQTHIHVHAFPFRMTEANLAAHADSRWIEFWRDLKRGHDAFDQTGLPPRVSVCDRHYAVETAGPQDPANHGITAECKPSRTAELLAPSAEAEDGDGAGSEPATPRRPVRRLAQTTSSRAGDTTRPELPTYEDERSHSFGRGVFER
jgi:murein L,D-transpeptidase YafK